jgi:hypothetical protein
MSQPAACLRVVCLCLVAAAACGETATAPLGTPDAPTGGDDGCAAKLPECLVNQQICVAGPRCASCPAGQHAAKTGRCEPLSGATRSHAFPEQTVRAGSEVLGLCRSWTVGNDEELWVNAVEFEQNELSHHSNWTFVPEGTFDGPDGIWRCADRNYHQLTAALAGGVLYAQSTQAVREVQRFPDGAAIRLPRRVRIISDIHLLNTTERDSTGNVKITLYSIPRDEVRVRLAPFHLDYHALDIPAQSVSRFTGDCDLSAAWMGATGTAPNAKIHYILPHTHALGSRFFVELRGGPGDGMRLMDIRGFGGDARGRAYDQPVDITGSSGFRFGCEFDNPRAVNVKWGFGDQEMCEMLGFAESPVIFEARVEETQPAGVDGDVRLFGGTCQTLLVPFNP